jgi:mRNA interferase MazF
MASSATFNFGDVILVPFPFTDQSGSKQRPAVIISSASYNGQRADLIIMAITSQIKMPLGFATSLIDDWQTAGLLKPSTFKPIFTTIEQTLIIRTLGKLTSSDRAQLHECVDSCLR